MRFFEKRKNSKIWANLGTKSIAKAYLVNFMNEESRIKQFASLFVLITSTIVSTTMANL